MAQNSFWEQLNVVKICKDDRLRFFECPPILFITMGIVNIASMVGGYYVSSNYIDEPQISALVAIFISLVIFVVGYFIVRSFERIANANRLKTDFLNIATHQMLTPLTSISWLAELLLSKKIEQRREKVLEYSWLIKKNNARMIKLITDLLDINRIDENRVEMHPEVVDLYVATANMVQEIVPESDSPEAEIDLSKTGEGFTVFIDPLRLKMVIQNLIDNAIKYSITKKDIRIGVLRKGNAVRFEISDKGVGIMPFERDKIFKKFSRVDRVKTTTAGSGLGLYIAKFIVEKVGGAIGFDSDGTTGTTFWFTLPAISANDKGPTHN